MPWLGEKEKSWVAHVGMLSFPCRPAAISVSSKNCQLLNCAQLDRSSLEIIQREANSV